MNFLEILLYLFFARIMAGFVNVESAVIPMTMAIFSGMIFTDIFIFGKIIGKIK